MEIYINNETQAIKEHLYANEFAADPNNPGFVDRFIEHTKAAEWEKTIRECRFSHFPIIDSNQEDVVGILDTKDYFRSEDKSKEYVMKNAVDDPYFVPENMKAKLPITIIKSWLNPWNMKR